MPDRAGPEPKNTDFPNRAQAVFIGSGLAALPRPGMTEGWHPSVSFQRNPRPRAMMPRNTSRVPPWIVSLGAIRVV